MLLRLGLSLVWRAGATLCCRAWASHCNGFSCCRARALGARASVVVACRLSSFGSRALECRLSSCSTWAYLLRDTWYLPWPGIEPVSPALAGGFLTTAPTGKSQRFFWCGPFLKSLSLFTVLLLFYVLVLWPRDMWALSSLTRDWTCTPCIGRWSLNHWTVREIPSFFNKTLNIEPCLTYNLNCEKPHQQRTLREKKHFVPKKPSVDRMSMGHGRTFVYQTKGGEAWRGGGTESMVAGGI